MAALLLSCLMVYRDNLGHLNLYEEFTLLLGFFGTQLRNELIVISGLKCYYVKNCLFES